MSSSLLFGTVVEQLPNLELKPLRAGEAHVLPHYDAKDAAEGSGIAVAEYGECSQGVFWCQNTNCIVNMQHGLVMWLRSKYLWHGTLPGVCFGDERAMRVGMAFFARSATLTTVMTEYRSAVTDGRAPKCSQSANFPHGEKKKKDTEKGTSKAKKRKKASTH